MKNKSFLILSISAAAVLVYGASGIFAQTPSGTVGKTVVERIAERFNLNRSDVQLVFDEHRSERHAFMKSKHVERLDQMVADGKITEAQKQAIITKMDELFSQKLNNHESFMNMTSDQRQEERLKHRDEMKKWANDNGIEWPFAFGGMMKHGFGMMK